MEAPSTPQKTESSVLDLGAAATTMAPLPSILPWGGIIPMVSMSEEEGEMKEEEEEVEKFMAMSDPGFMVPTFSVPTLDKIAAMAFSASDEVDDFTHRLSASLTRKPRLA